MDRVDTMVQDVRHALRGLRRNPGYAWTFIATLALGIGATGAIFSVLDAVMLRPLPFHEPDRIVEARLSTGQGFLLDLSPEQLRGWRTSADFLSGIAAHRRVSTTRVDRGEAEQLNAVGVSPELDEVLGISAARGRLFSPEDAEPGTRVLVMTWRYWMETGAPPDVVGSSVILEDASWTVIGVLPASVEFPVTGRVDVWIPIAGDGTAAGLPLERVGLVGRLADAVEIEAARERADVLAHSLAEAAGEPLPEGWSVRVRPLDEYRVNQQVKTGLILVSAAVGLIFLIALVNAINLMLVRAWDRGSELSVRRALGASCGRVVHQVFAEAVVLSLIGGVVATGVAALCVAGIGAIAPSDLTFTMIYGFELERRALAVVFLTAFVAGLLVAPLPAFAAATTRIRGAGPARDHGRDRAGTRIRGALVVTQVALSVVLLVGAGLFLRSFSRMMNQDQGMDMDRVAMAIVELPDSRYREPAARADFTERLLDELRRLPTTESAVMAMGAPPDGGGLTFGEAVQGEGHPAVDAPVMLPMTLVSEGYLATLGTRLVAGRDFEPGDRDARALIIDSDFAVTAFGRTDVAGERVRLSEDGSWRPIVGVVEELRLGGIDDRVGDMALLQPYDPDEPPSYQTFLVRTSEPEAALAGIRRAVQAVDPRLPLRFLGTGRDALGEDAVRPRFLVLLMSILSGVAVSLAAIGVYGVLSFVVRRRQHEVGIRIALGAPLPRIRRQILSWGLKVAGLGAAAGLLIAASFDDAVGSLLYGIEPGDPATRVVAVAVVMAVVIGACLVPAARAVRADPVRVLNADQA